MTVAVGTLNGLIFHANVVHANQSILPTSASNEKLYYHVHIIAELRTRN